MSHHKDTPLPATTADDATPDTADTDADADVPPRVLARLRLRSAAAATTVG